MLDWESIAEQLPPAKPDAYHAEFWAGATVRPVAWLDSKAPNTMDWWSVWCAMADYRAHPWSQYDRETLILAVAPRVQSTAINRVRWSMGQERSADTGGADYFQEGLWGVIDTITKHGLPAFERERPYSDVEVDPENWALA